MSDYMFMLESHLSSEQSGVVHKMQTAGAEAGVNLFLTGGALRDMLAGFPIGQLEFTMEGNALKLAKPMAAKIGAEIASVDEHRKSVQLAFPGGALATLRMARQERSSKPGSKSQAQPASIHEDLRGRDFTINSIALSLNPASKGLLLDPNNGVGDVQHKELRAVTNYVFYDDPVRLLRLQRFKVRLAFTIAERTLNQYQNAREAGLETGISAAALLEELQHTAAEQNVADVLRALEEERLLRLYSPAFAAGKLNVPLLQKLQKAKQMAPSEADLHTDHLAILLNALTDKLAPAEKSALAETLGMTREQVDAWQKLEARSKKLEKDLKSARLTKPSQVYSVSSKAPGEQVFYLLIRSSERLAQDRLRNYLQKYLPAALEVTERDVVATGVQSGTPKYLKAHAAMIAARLDARPKKPAPVPPPDAPSEPPVTPAMPPHAFARKSAPGSSGSPG